MSVRFKVFDTQLEFHDDLKKYYELSCEFQAAHDSVYNTIKNDFNNQKEPTDIFQIIEASIKQFVGDLINRLSNYGVFDRTASDYLNTNNGYLQILNATTAYYEYAKSSTERNHAIAEASKESASTSINSSISGLDFGIISSSIVDHAVYSAMNKAEIQKQSLAAFSRYCAICDTINTSRDSRISAEISEYYTNHYIPTMITALSALYGCLLSTYTNDLNACGQIDLACLEHIDLQRSNEIIYNIDNVDNKRGVFLKAIELCPYNIYAYQKGYSAYLYPQGLSITEICGDLIKYFNLEKALNSILVPVSSLCDKAKQYLIHNDYHNARETYEAIASIYPKKHFGWLGLLLCETEKFTNTAPDMQIVEEYFSKTIDTVGNSDLLNKIELKFNDYKRNIKQYEKLLNEKEESENQDGINQGLLLYEQKDRSKWLIFMVLFGLITLILCIITFFVDHKAIFVLLLCSGITAVQIYSYNDSRRKIAKYKNELSKSSQKEKEIHELKSTIISNSASIKELL